MKSTTSNAIFYPKIGTESSSVSSFSSRIKFTVTITNSNNKFHAQLRISHNTGKAYTGTSKLNLSNVSASRIRIHLKNNFTTSGQIMLLPQVESKADYTANAGGKYRRSKWQQHSNAYAPIVVRESGKINSLICLSQILFRSTASQTFFLIKMDAPEI